MAQFLLPLFIFNLHVALIYINLYYKVSSDPLSHILSKDKRRRRDNPLDHGATACNTLKQVSHSPRRRRRRHRRAASADVPPRRRGSCIGVGGGELRRVSAELW